MKNRKIITFARRKSRGFTVAQHDLLNVIMPKVAVNLNDIAVHKEYCLEIGFGKGEHIANLAMTYPMMGYIGCEPYMNGVVHLLKLIDHNKINNISIYNDDARDLLIKIPEKFFTKIYVLFPDPWPKHKHHKRRIINQIMLDLLIGKIKKNGELIIATDHEEYAVWIYNHLISYGLLVNMQGISAYQQEPVMWVKTRYQKKAESKGLKPYFFVVSIVS